MCYEAVGIAIIVAIMDDGDRMAKINLDKDKLTNIEKEYMQRVHQKNLDRVQKFTKTRNKNRFLGLGLGVGVVSIYSYTLWAIKQEKFLDDFEEPEKLSD